MFTHNQTLRLIGSSPQLGPADAASPNTAMSRPTPRSSEAAPTRNSEDLFLTALLATQPKPILPPRHSDSNKSICSSLANIAKMLTRPPPRHTGLRDSNTNIFCISFLGASMICCRVSAIRVEQNRLRLLNDFLKNICTFYCFVLICLGL